MNDVADYLKRVLKRTGLKRESFIEKNIPTEPSNILAIPFFGDVDGLFIFSTFILKNFIENNPDKYLILISWPGMQGLFPEVHEYWTIEDENTLRTLATNSNFFYNNSNVYAEIVKSITEVLNIQTAKDFGKYWEKGFSKKYWDDFGQIKRYLPEVPSSTVISNDLKNNLNKLDGKNVLVYPITKMKSWQSGATKRLAIQKDFWVAIIERLLKEKFTPVIFQNIFTYDMSPDFADRCLYLTPRSAGELLASMRSIGLVLDIHSGVSKMAIMARTPYLSVTERQIYVNDKDYEIDDLCTLNLPHKYIFSFSTQLMVGTPDEWEISVISNIIIKINDLLNNINNFELPSTKSSYEPVSYESVRNRISKRLGSHFIKTSKIK